MRTALVDNYLSFSLGDIDKDAFALDKTSASSNLDVLDLYRNSEYHRENITMIAMWGLLNEKHNHDKHDSNIR